MAAQIINGKEIAAEIRSELKEGSGLDCSGPHPWSSSSAGR